MRTMIAIVAALALAGPVVAQPKKAPAKPAAPAAAAKAALPTAAEMKDATDTLSLLVSAFNSKDIPADTKDGLLLCLYGNPLGKISKGLADTVAGDPKIDGKSPTQRLLVIAALCGAPVPQAKAAPAEPGKDK